MSVDIITSKKTWYIFPLQKNAGVVEANQNITSPHEVELFNNEADWQNRKDELGITDVE